MSYSSKHRRLFKMRNAANSSKRSRPRKMPKLPTNRGRSVKSGVRRSTNKVNLGWIKKLLFHLLILDLTMEVLKNRIENYGMSLYVISHNKHIDKHIDGETVMLEKEHGVTRRILD